MAREQSKVQKRSDESTLDRRSYLKLAGSATAAVAAGTANALASSESASTSPVIERMDISKSSQLGASQMFVVKWAVADSDSNLDVVEVVVDDGNSDLDFSVQNVSGESASGWELFQFPLDTTLDIHVRAKDSTGNVSKRSETITLGNDSSDDEPEADIHLTFDDPSDLDTFTKVGTDYATISNAPGSKSGTAMDISLPSGDHYGTNRQLDFEPLTGSMPEQAHAEFDLYIPTSFEFEDGAGPGGAKLGGFSHRDTAGWGGRPSDGTNGWSSRLFNINPDNGSWSRDCGLGSYIYHADMSGTYGDELHWDVGVNKGQWHHIEQYVELNTPGANDGVVRGWVDDDLAFERTDLRFRNEGYDQYKIEDYWVNVYFGGSWTAPTDTNVYMDDLKIRKNVDSP